MRYLVITILFLALAGCGSSSTPGNANNPVEYSSVESLPNP